MNTFTDRDRTLFRNALLVLDIYYYFKLNNKS